MDFPYISAGAYSAEEFLRVLSENWDYRGPNSSGATPQLEKAFDIAIVGPCSDGYLTCPVPGSSAAQLATTFINVVLRPPRDTGILSGESATKFSCFLSPDDEKTVLLIATCCGQYSSSFREALKKAFPRVTWLFPQHQDFYGQVRGDQAARMLLQEGILKKQEVPAEI